MEPYKEMIDECIICFYPLNKNKTIKLRCCDNIIHDKCLYDWLRVNDRSICPRCNQKVVIKLTFMEKYLCFCRSY